MQYKILYCTKCYEEFKNVFQLFGDYCPHCDTKLQLGYHFKEGKVSGVKFVQKIKYDVRNKEV